MRVPRRSRRLRRKTARERPSADIGVAGGAIRADSRKQKQNALLPFFLSVSARAGKAGIQFSDQVTSAVLQVLMETMTPTEKARAGKLFAMMKKLPKEKGQK